MIKAKNQKKLKKFWKNDWHKNFIVILYCSKKAEVLLLTHRISFWCGQKFEYLCWWKFLICVIFGRTLRPTKFFIKKEITTIFKELLINDQITSKEVRLIGEEGEQLGVLSKSEAQDIADKQGLDLVLMSPNANPPVCKLMDYGKYKFDTIKKEKEIRKNQKISEVKEIQLSMRIDDYHISFKLKNAQKILQDGDKVKVSLRMRGREQAYSQNAVEIVKKFVQDLSEYGSIDKEPAIMGRNVFVVINPKKS